MPVGAIVRGSSNDVRLSQDAGFAAHMTKPVDFLKLQQLIEQLT